MSRRTEKKIANNEPLKKWVWFMVSILVFCLFSYGYFVRGAIVNIVARQNMETEFNVLNSKVSDLEAEYIKAENIVTPELAANLGFVAVTGQRFVTRETKSPGLSVLTPGN